MAENPTENPTEIWAQRMYGKAVDAISAELQAGCRHAYLAPPGTILTQEGPKILGNEIERLKKTIFDQAKLQDENLRLKETLQRQKEVHEAARLSHEEDKEELRNQLAGAQIELELLKRERDGILADSASTWKLYEGLCDLVGKFDRGDY